MYKVYKTIWRIKGENSHKKTCANYSRLETFSSLIFAQFSLQVFINRKYKLKFNKTRNFFCETNWNFRPKKLPHKNRHELFSLIFSIDHPNKREEEFNSFQAINIWSTFSKQTRRKAHFCRRTSNVFTAAYREFLSVSYSSAIGDNSQSNVVEPEQIVSPQFWQ